MKINICKSCFFNLLVLGIILTYPTIVRAQFQGNVYEPFQDAIVNQYGSNLLSPWCGGINSVHLN